MFYLERCKEVAERINPDTLASLTFNEVWGSGGSFVFRGLGAIPIIGASEFVGLKLPKRTDADPEFRVVTEIAQVSLLTTLSPALIPKIPHFTCYLQVEGEVAAALLTEDATQGGAKKIRPMKASAETRALLYEPFKAYGTMDKVLEQETLDIATASNVDGEERLLDFTPEPISGWILYVANELGPYLREANDQLPQLTVTISADTPLGDSLCTRYMDLPTT